MSKEQIRPSGLPEYDTLFWSFVLDPAERIRLKTLCENARNYTIAVAVLAGGVVVFKRATNVAALAAGSSLSIAGATLTIFSFLQTWLISLRLFDQYHGFESPSRPWDTTYRLVGVFGSLVALPLAVWYLVSLLIEQLTHR